MTIIQGGKQETSTTAPISEKRRVLLLVKGNRPGKQKFKGNLPFGLTEFEMKRLVRDAYRFHRESLSLKESIRVSA